MHGSQDLIGDNWLDIYLTSPIWRFALSSGCIDHNAWAGILVPSVDSVGRYFPLTLLAPIDNNSNLFQFQQNSDAWYLSLQEIAMAALQNSLPADAVMQQLSQLETPTSPAQSKQPLNNGARVATGSSIDINSSFAPLLGDIYAQSCPSHSLWWCQGSQRMSPTSLISPALPEPSQYASMLGGDWQANG